MSTLGLGATLRGDPGVTKTLRAAAAKTTTLTFRIQPCLKEVLREAAS